MPEVKNINHLKMKIFDTLEIQFLQILDRFYARWPQAVPDKDRLQHCKIISHRGDYDNRNVFENTMNAFDRALDQGVWGIEFDLRWTKDLNPVAIHDADLRRVFGLDFSMRQVTLAELKSPLPPGPVACGNDSKIWQETPSDDRDKS